MVQKAKIRRITQCIFVSSGWMRLGRVYCVRGDTSVQFNLTNGVIVLKNNKPAKKYIIQKIFLLSYSKHKKQNKKLEINKKDD